MRGLLITAAMAPVYAQHNTIESTFNMLSVSVSNSVGYVLNVPINMGTLETFLSGKDVNAPLSSPIIATTSVDMAASGSLTQQTLWGSVLIENVKSFIAFEDTGTCQFYGPSSMAFRSSDPGSSCPATTSTIPSENTGAAHEQARAGNCLTDWHLDGMGVKTTSYRNTDFDPRTRSWYMETKAAKTPTWSSLYSLDQMGELGITYALPLYSTQSNPDSTLLGQIGFDVNLNNVEQVLADNNIQNVVQYIVASATNELVATSVGENKITSAGAVKMATHADNFIIRESAAMLARITTDGFYYYESLTDDSDYVMRVTTFSRGSSSLLWKIIAVTEEDHIPDMSVKANIVLADLNAALDDFMQNTESLAYYLEFMAGKRASAPLSTVIVEDSTTAQLSSVTHQALWGTMNTFPEVADVMVTYSNKKMYHFHADNTKMFFRDSGSTSLYKEYAIDSRGAIIGDSVSSASYDPTTEPFYTVATKTAAFTHFFADPSDTPEPEIAFSVPFFSSPFVLDGVISTTMTLQDFENVLVEFTDTAVAYFILDEGNRLVATSYAENTWDATAGALILGSSSSNTLVRTASTYITQNAINVDNTFILQNDMIGLEDMIMTMKQYNDGLNLLHWKIVSVQYYDEDAWGASDSDSDDEVAEAVAIVLGVMLFVVVAVVVGMLALGKLTCAGAKSSETQSLSNTGAKSSETL